MILSRTVIIALFLLLMGLGNGNALADSGVLTVGSLHKKCRLFLRYAKKLDAPKRSKRQLVDMVTCSAFVTGFNFGKVTTNILNETHGPYCPPNGYDRGDKLIRIFVNWAAKHPRMRRKPAASGILRAMQELYRCDEQDFIKR